MAPRAGVPEIRWLLRAAAQAAAGSLGGHPPVAFLVRDRLVAEDGADASPLGGDVARALAEGASGALLPLVQRRSGPFEIRTAALSPDAGALAATLRAHDVESLAVVPLLGEATVLACLLAPAPAGWDPSREGDAWGTVCRAPAALQVAAGSAVLDALQGLHARQDRARIVGAVVVDGEGRVILADGALRDVAAWRHPDPFGRPLAELPAEPLGETLLTAVPGDGAGGRVLLLGASGGRGAEAAAPWPLTFAARVHAAAGAVAAAADAPGRLPGDPPSVEALAALADCARDTRERARVVAGWAGVEAEVVTVDLGAAAAAVLEDLAAGLSQSRIRVFSFLTPAPCPVPPDLLAVRELLQALVARSRRALARHGGTLTVRTWTEVGWACAAVSDDGGGARGAPRPGAVEGPGEAGSRPDGTLDEVAAVVESLGGRFQLESRPGVWNRCTLMLPATGGAGSAARPTETRVTRGADGALSVLVVDDNAALRSVLRRYLERRGYRVTEACDGDDALRVVGQQGGRFDRLVVDVHMPGRSGPELFAGLAGVAPHLQGRTLFMTGDLQEPGTERFLAETGRPAIAKPFDLADLLRKLEGAA